MNLGKVEPPSDDRRWRLVGATMRRHGYQSQALIETLHTVQQSFGYLDEAALRYVSGALHVPASRVYGVSTFYAFFTLKPQGRHTCVVCTGTACYIKGATMLLEEVARAFHVSSGETTADGQLSLLTARCLGSCGLAPAAVFDGEVLGKLSPPAVLEKLRTWTDHAA
jgi:bidirectional [NiFe] hydrogenase diaphorase subunit